MSARVRPSLMNHDQPQERAESPDRAGRLDREPGWVNVLDRKLHELPNRRAPSTLLPRVMAAIQARASLPWYRRSWWEWPSVWQVLSLLGVSGLLGLVTWSCGPGSSGFLAQAGALLTDWMPALEPMWTLLGTLARALALVVKQVGGWTILAGLGLCLAMYLSCIGVGTVFYRLVNPRRNS